MNRNTSILLLAALAAASSCSGGDSGSASSDAGPDMATAGQAGSSGTAGSSGSGPDSGTGASSGAAGTVGAGGAGTAGQGGDAGTAWWDPSVTDWNPVPWAPAGCDLTYAVNPAAAAPPLDWKACVGGLAGCEMLQPTWPADATYSSMLAAVGHDASGYRFNVDYFFIRNNSGLQKVYVVYDDAGVPAAVVHNTGPCTLFGDYAAGDQTCIVVADTRITDAGTEPTYVACGPGTTAVTLPAPTATFGVPLPQGTFSGELLALRPMNPAVNEVLDVPAKQFHLLTSPTQGAPTYHPFAVASHVLVRATVATQHDVGVLWSKPDTTVTLVDPAAPRSVADIRSDGKDLVWIESDAPYDNQGYYADGYVYTAPFVEDPALLQPRLIRDFGSKFPVDPVATAGGGYYLLYRVFGSLDLIRMSDGHRWSITPPGGLTPAGTPIAVDATNAFYGAAKGGINEPAMIVRQRIDALGPGD